MRLAYVVLAHTVPEQLGRLLRVLDDRDGEDHVFLHVDAKVDLPPFLAAMGDVARRPHVHLVDRVSVAWGDRGMLLATVNGVRAAVASGVPFDELVLLTGRDYPIKPLDAIRDHLRAHEGRFFLDAHPLPRPDFDEEGGLERLRHPHLTLPMPRRSRPYVGRRLVRLPTTRALPDGLDPWQGSAFWWLPRDLVAYVHDVLVDRPDVLRFFLRAFAPEESFFHMVLMSSPHRDRLVNDYLRYTEWRPEHWPHGTVLEAPDIDKLAATDALFASKFDVRRDAEVLDLVDARLLGRP